MRKKLLIGVCLFLSVTCIGCSTIRGVGKDISTLGGWVTKGVDNVQEK